MFSPAIMQLLNSLAPIIIITLIFIFLIFRPQYKKANEHKKMLANLKIEDEVITHSGVIGKIKKIEDNLVTLEVAKDVEIQFAKSTILEIFDKNKFVATTTEVK